MYTDHKTLLNFHTQRDMSRRQACCMEELSIYNCKFVYVKGTNNSVADALSRYPYTTAHVSSPTEVEATACHPYNNTDTSNIKYNVLHHPDPQNSQLSTIGALVDSTLPKATRASLVIDDKLVNNIQESYSKDPWCQKLLSASKGMLELIIKDGLWFLGTRLIIPAGCGAREHIFHLTHDALGHFGFL